MMRVAVWGNDLSDTYLRTVTQLGAEAIDMGRGAFFPGVSESGYPDADALAGLVLKLRPLRPALQSRDAAGHHRRVHAGPRRRRP